MEEATNISNYEETPEVSVNKGYQEEVQPSTSEPYTENTEESSWAAASEVSPSQTDGPGRNIHNHKEDITFDNDVWVGGTLRAKRIVHPWGCLFKTIAHLQSELPHPHPGMWAIVGSVYPFDTYRCRVDGEWELVDKQSVYSQITDYLTDKNYATESWVENKLKDINSFDVEALKQYLNANNYVTQNWIEQYYSYQGGSGILGNYLPRIEFDDMFEWVTVGTQRFIRAKATLVSVGNLVALYKGDGVLDPTYATVEMLGQYATKEELQEALAGIGPGGIDTTELQQYLTEHHYITSSQLPDLSGYALKTEIPSLADYYNKTAVDAMLTTINNSIASFESALGDKLDAVTFDEMFEWVTVGTQRFIRAKATLVSVGNLVALYKGDGVLDPTYATVEMLGQYATKEELQEALAGIGPGGIDTTELQQYLTEHHYITSSQLPDLSGYALKTEIPSLADYYNKTAVDAMLTTINNSIASFESALGDKLDTVTFDEMFEWVTVGTQRFIRAKATLVSVGNLVALYKGDDVPSSSVGLDLAALESYLEDNNYVTKDWVLNQGFLTGLAGYATESWVNSQGFLKQHQSLANYVTINTAQEIVAGKTFHSTYLKLIGNNLSNTANRHSSGVLSFQENNYDDQFGIWGYFNGTGTAQKLFIGGSGAGTSLGNDQAGTVFTPYLTIEHTTGNLTVLGKIIKSGGTSSQFLKADGSVDSNSYALASALGSYLRKDTGNVKTIGKSVDGINAINNDANTWASNYTLSLVNANNALNFYVGGEENERKAMIQVGHSSPSYAQYLGILHLNKLGGAVYINNSLALTAANYSDTLDSRYVHGYYVYCGWGTTSLQWIWGSNLTHVVGFEGADRGTMRVYNGDAIRTFANAVNKSGDTMSGNLTVPKVNINAAGSNGFISSDSADNIYMGVSGKSMLVLNGSENAVRPALSLNNAISLGSTASRWSNLYATTINVTSTNLVSNLNADLLDGVHLASLLRSHSLAKQNLDANNLATDWVCYIPNNDMNTWGDATFTNFPTARPEGGFCLINLKEGNYLKQIYTRYNDNHLYIRNRHYHATTPWSAWSTIAFTTDNVASATRLATTATYTAWGQTYFANGVPQSVSGNMTGVGSITASGGIYQSLAASSWAESKNAYSPNMGADNRVVVRLGKSGSSYNAGYVAYHHKADGSTNNFISLGLWSQDEVLNVVGSGNVGFGTTAPAYKVDINGTLRASNSIISNNSNSFRSAVGNYGLILRNDGTNSLFLLTASGDPYGTWNNLRPFYINNASGWVTMANGASISKLNVGSPALESYALNTTSFICDSWVRTRGATGWYSETYGGGIYMDSANWVKTYLKPMYISSTMIEGPSGFGVGLRCYSAGHTSVEVQGGNYTMGLGCHYNGHWYWWRGTNGTTVANKSYVMDYDGSIWYFTGTIKASGNLVALSDMRVKSHITDLEFRGRLHPKRYWKDGRWQIGFIAQDVDELYSETVFKSNLLSLDYGALTAVLAAQVNNNTDDIVAMKEQIRNLEIKVETLEAENKQFKQLLRA